MMLGTSSRAVHGGGARRGRLVHIVPQVNVKKHGPAICRKAPSPGSKGWGPPQKDARITCQRCITILASRKNGDLTAPPAPRTRADLANVHLLIAKGRDNCTDDEKIQLDKAISGFNDRIVSRNMDGGYRKPHVPFNAERKLTYLREVCEHGQLTIAAAAAGVNASTVSKHRRKPTPENPNSTYDPEFATAVEVAVESYADSLEHAATTRGRDGIVKPVYQGGVLVGYVREYSDSLLTTLLKSARPKKFRENVKQEVEHTGGVLVVPGRSMSPADWQEQYKHEALGQGAQINEEDVTDVEIEEEVPG